MVDGEEGGTGAAPVEFANRVGMPMLEGLTFVHNTLRGAGIRDQVRIGAAGTIAGTAQAPTALRHPKSRMGRFESARRRKGRRIWPRSAV